MQNYCVKDGKLINFREYSELIPSARSVVYEVLRVINGVPLFEEEHYKRLNISILSVNNKFETYAIEKLTDWVKKLITAEKIDIGNIKIEVDLCLENHCLSTFYCYRLPHFYPSTENYKKGVKVSVLEIERPAPNTKMIRTDYNQLVMKEIESRKVFEVFLKNHAGLLTEGSKSNILLVKNNTVYSAPDNLILKGITRQIVQQICEENQIQFETTSIHSSDLPTYQAACITGTSPKVLPISDIEDCKFDINHPILLKLMQLYNSKIEDYLKNY